MALFRAYDRDMHGTPPHPPNTSNAATIPALSAIARAPIKPCQVQELSLPCTKKTHICIYCIARSPTFDSR
jgi:hypothetical protein